MSVAAPTAPPSTSMPEAKSSELSAWIERQAQALRLDIGAVRRLVPAKTHVSDDPDKWLVLGRRGEPLGVVHHAPAGAPEIVARGVERARSARDVLGSGLGEVVLLPQAEGRAGERSVCWTSWMRPLSRRRIVGRLHGYSVAPRLLDWLHAAVDRSKRPLDDAQRAALGDALGALSEQAALDDGVRRDAQGARERLGQRHAWTVLVHNDLWLGNVLLPVDSARWRFRLIDWAGAAVDGHPFWDLIRITESLRLPVWSVRRAAKTHATVLGWSAQDAKDGLLDALAHLDQHREDMPVERFAAMARTTVDALERAVG